MVSLSATVSASREKATSGARDVNETSSPDSAGSRRPASPRTPAAARASTERSTSPSSSTARMSPVATPLTERGSRTRSRCAAATEPARTAARIIKTVGQTPGHRPCEITADASLIRERADQPVARPQVESIAQDAGLRAGFDAQSPDEAAFLQGQGQVVLPDASGQDVPALDSFVDHGFSALSDPTQAHGLQHEVDVPIVLDLEAQTALLNAGIDDRAVRLGLGGPQEDRNAHASQDAHARDARGEARVLRGRELFDEHAVGLLACGEGHHGPDADPALPARFERQEPREEKIGRAS